MGVNDGVDVRTCLINAGVDESLDRGCAPVRSRLALQGEFDQIAALDHLRRRKHMSDEESFGVFPAPNTDMAVSIDDVFISKNTVRDHELVEGLFQSDHQ